MYNNQDHLDFPFKMSAYLIEEWWKYAKYTNSFFVKDFFGITLSLYIHIYIHKLKRNVPISIQNKTKESGNMISPWGEVIRGF